MAARTLGHGERAGRDRDGALVQADSTEFLEMSWPPGLCDRGQCANIPAAALAQPGSFHELLAPHPDPRRLGLPGLKTLRSGLGRAREHVGAVLVERHTISARAFGQCFLELRRDAEKKHFDFVGLLAQR